MEPFNCYEDVAACRNAASSWSFTDRQTQTDTQTDETEHITTPHSRVAMNWLPEKIAE